MKRPFYLLAALCALLLSASLLPAQDSCRVGNFAVLAGEFKFPEGPAFDSQGNLYVVDYKRVGDIGVIHPDGTVEQWLDLGASEANGMVYSPDGRLLCCDDALRRIIAVDLKTKKITPVIEAFGDSLHRPNDIALAPNGDIYFTNPNRKDESVGGDVYCYSQSQKKLYHLLDSLPYPNGLTVNPERTELFVALTVGHKIIRCPLSEDGHKAGPVSEIFSLTGGAGPDGIELDEHGNIYVAHYGMSKVYYITAQGKLLGCLTGLGTDVTNVQVRGEWLYVTEAQRGQVLRIKRSEFLAE